MARQVFRKNLEDLREEAILQGLDQKFAAVLGLIDAELLLRDGTSTFWVNQGHTVTTFVVVTEDKSVGYTVYSTDAEDLRKVLLQVVDWQERIRFTAPAQLFPLLDNITRERAPHFDLDFHVVGNSYSVTDDSLIMHSVPEGYTLGQLEPSDAIEVNDCWEFNQGEASLPAIERQIKMYPSACVRNAAGRLAAFELVSPLLTLTILFTYPEHRGKGLAAAVTSELSRRVIKLRGMAYLYVELTNFASASIQKKCGYSIMDGSTTCLALFVPGDLECSREE